MNHTHGFSGTPHVTGQLVPIQSVVAFGGGERPAPEPRWRTMIIRGVTLLALVVSIIYLFWRIWYTVDPAVWWVSVPLFLLELHAFVGLALFAFSLWDVDHNPPTWKVEATSAKLAVLVPTYNEGQEILLPTIAAAVAIRLPHDTWVLDDGDRPWVAQLAAELGARYLTRPEHTHAKAGNINHALQYINADYVAILDADHVAKPDLFANTLGYFDDPAIAIVQTPQDFYNRDSFEHERPAPDGLGTSEKAIYHEQTLFYRLLQPGKNRWDAAFWCGTNAVVRVAALREVGGIATETITEDIHTTIKLHRRGWKTIYHNEVLARGLAATNSSQYMLQRFRWGCGAMQVLRIDNPLTTPGLRLTQRLAYAATLLGWFDAWRSLGYLLIPILVLFTGAVPIRSQPLTFLMAFGATFILQQCAMRLLSRGSHRPLTATIFELVRMTPNILATLTLLRPGSFRFQVTPKGRTGDQRERMNTPRLLLVVEILSVTAGVWFFLSAAGVTTTQYGVMWAAIGAAFWLIVNLVFVIFAIARVRSFRYASERRRSVRFATVLRGAVGQRDCEIHDVSLTGAQVVMSTHSMIGLQQEDELTIRVEEARLHLRVIVRSRRLIAGERIEYGLEFTDGQTRERGQLALVLFNAHLLPQIEVTPEPAEVA